MPQDKQPVENENTEYEGIMPMISIRNEKEAWKHIMKVMDIHLEKFPQTLEDDDKILETDETQNNLTVNQKNCVLYRRNEK